jgi:hypothetical protein
VTVLDVRLWRRTQTAEAAARPALTAAEAGKAEAAMPAAMGSIAREWCRVGGWPRGGCRSDASRREEEEEGPGVRRLEVLDAARATLEPEGGLVATRRALRAAWCQQARRRTRRPTPSRTRRRGALSCAAAAWGGVGGKDLGAGLSGTASGRVASWCQMSHCQEACAFDIHLFCWPGMG